MAVNILGGREERLIQLYSLGGSEQGGIAFPVILSDAMRSISYDWSGGTGEGVVAMRKKVVEGFFEAGAVAVLEVQKANFIAQKQVGGEIGAGWEAVLDLRNNINPMLASMVAGFKDQQYGMGWAPGEAAGRREEYKKTAVGLFGGMVGDLAVTGGGRLALFVKGIKDLADEGDVAAGGMMKEMGAVVGAMVEIERDKGSGGNYDGFINSSATTAGTNIRGQLPQLGEMGVRIE